MSKLLVVFGATGQQGGSVINYVLNDSDLSKQYVLRGISRDITSPVSKELRKKGVEMVQADASKPETLSAALENAHTVFIVTVSCYEPDGKEVEVKQGMAIISVSLTQGAEFLIFSSLPAAQRLYNRRVDIFDAKAEIEQVIRVAPVNSAFFAPGMFMQNFQTVMVPRPTSEEGVYEVVNIAPPDVRIPLIDICEDTGKYVGAILAAPELHHSRLLSASAKFYSFQEMVDAISNVSGKKVIYKQVCVETFTKSLPESRGKALVDMMAFFADVGYYGPQSEEVVEWTAKQARGELTSFEQFLERNPLQF